jgi:hypothetical protein
MELRDGQMITKETFIGAKFIDNERQFVEVMLNMDHTEEIHLTPLVIEADEENPHFQDLMGLVSMDQLHEDTWNEKKAESDAFIETAKAVMMESGLLEAETALSKTKMFPTLVENIFTNMENEDHLFALKLALFELQDIRESENVEEKTALRKAQNKIDILQHAFNIMGVKGTGDDAPATTDPVANAKALDKAEATMAAELKMPKHQRPATVARKTAATVAKKNPPKKGKK